MSGESSRTTHQAHVAIDACRYLGALIIGVVGSSKKQEILSPFYSPTPRYWDKCPLNSEVTNVINGSFKRLNLPDIKAAIWAFYRRDTFEEGWVMAVNLGDDADTTGAVYG